MTIEELYNKKVEEIKAFGSQTQNELFVRYGILMERISKTVLEYLHEEGKDGQVDGEMIVGVYFAHCWSVARFAKFFDSFNGSTTKEMLPHLLELCLNAEDLVEKEIRFGKEAMV